jgi:quinoprotein glucose dehydrogenase
MGTCGTGHAKRRIAVVCVAVAGVGWAAAAETASTSQSAATGSAVERTVWDGVYNDAQAKRGQELYQQECSSCHLDSLGGADMAPALAGDAFMTQWNDLSLGDLFDRIRISMPQDKPATLSRQAYADIVAHMLKENHMPAGSAELQDDIAVLKQIKVLAKRPGPK